MFKKWKSVFSSSNNSAFVQANNEVQHANLLEPEEQQVDTDVQQQKQLPLLTYWIYFAYGVAMLLPWNVFITASDYFSVRFAGSDYQDNFQNYFSAYFNCSNLISLAVLLWKRQKRKIDIIVPLSINLAIFSFFAVSSLTAPTSAAAEPYFWITIVSMIITGMTTSVIQLAVFAETSQMPSKYVQAVMSGQGISSVSVALFSLLTTLLFKEQQQQHQFDAIMATFYYFVSALLVTLIAIAGRFASVKQPSYQPLHATIVDSIPMTFTNDDDDDDDSRTNTDKSAMWDVMTEKSVGYIFTIVYIYMITLALFPSVTVLVRSANRIDPATFISLHFLLFNLGDWIGRSLPIFPCCQVYSSKALICLSLARTCFIPLFFNCNLEQQQNNLLSSDMLYFMILLLFAMSNGWLTSLVFIAAPSRVSRNDKPLVGSVISFFLVVGLALGGLSSFLFF